MPSSNQANIENSENTAIELFWQAAKSSLLGRIRGEDKRDSVWWPCRQVTNPGGPSVIPKKQLASRMIQ